MRVVGLRLCAENIRALERTKIVVTKTCFEDQWIERRNNWIGQRDYDKPYWIHLNTEMVKVAHARCAALL